MLVSFMTAEYLTSTIVMITKQISVNICVLIGEPDLLPEFKARFFLLVDLRDFFFRFRAWGTEKKKKKL